MNQQYLNTRQIAQLLGLSVSTLKRLRKQPSGPPWTRLGSQIRYYVPDVRDWMIANQGRHKRDVEYLDV
ncbi:MAG: helix-turn-helix domain-containing protein [Litorimonas sp.]